FSLILSDYEKQGVRHENRYRPRVVLKNIDSKRALKGFSSCREPETYEGLPSLADDLDGGDAGEPAGVRGDAVGAANPANQDQSQRHSFRGNLLDLRTLAFALTNRGHSLSSACKAFGVEHGKVAVEAHGQVTPEYIAYCRRD